MPQVPQNVRGVKLKTERTQGGILLDIVFSTAGADAVEKWESLKTLSKPVQLPPQCITSFHVAALFANLNKSLSILKNAYTCISLAYKTMSDCFNVRLTAF